MLWKIIIAFFILSNTSLANTDKCTEPSLVAELDGCEYLCLSPVMAKDMFSVYNSYPDLRLRLGKSIELLEVRADTIQVMANIHINLGDQKIVLQEEVVGLRKELTNVNKWYKSPYLWTCVGIVLGTSLAVGLTYAVNGG